MENLDQEKRPQAYSYVNSTVLNKLSMEFSGERIFVRNFWKFFVEQLMIYEVDVVKKMEEATFYM